MSRITGIMLVRNEEGRWLESVLKQMRELCNTIVVLDDGSSDRTPEICKEYGVRLWRNSRSVWEQNELLLRQALWQFATSIVTRPDWILCLDADETLELAALHIDWENILHLAESNNIDGIGFRLHDMWSKTHYRSDALWNAHSRLWTMLIRFDPDRNYVWRETPLHCGRFPINAVTKMLDVELRLQHWGWSREEDRKQKYERYMRTDPNGVYGSLAQYQSILDPAPNLVAF